MATREQTVKLGAGLRSYMLQDRSFAFLWQGPGIGLGARPLYFHDGGACRSIISDDCVFME